MLFDPSLRRAPYAGYVYSYPHKTAHRPIRPAIPLRDVWANEPTGSLFLYFHIPFCESRCAFCNLFSAAGAGEEMIADYIHAIDRQAEAVDRALDDSRQVARLAIGGGTPGMLTVEQLDSLFDIAARRFGADLRSTPTSVELSPRTATDERLDLLRGRHVDRVSLGVQTFDAAETSRLGRPHRPDEAAAAIERIGSYNFPRLNIDLIYGIEGQTDASWSASLDRTLELKPEEIYLYPLYRRAETPLGETTVDDDRRLVFYRQAREALRSARYRQISMRMFSRTEDDATAPEYCCQSDGMIGLGVGARSYTRDLHYSHPFAVRRPEVLEIISRFVAKSTEAHGRADWGIHLDAEDRRRRFILLSLLQVAGLSLTDYRAEFATEATDDLPELTQLVDAGLADRSTERLCLTEQGIELSDLIGPWLFSDRVRKLMEDFQFDPIN